MSVTLPALLPDARPRLRVFEGEAEQPRDRLEDPENRRLIMAALVRCEEARLRVVEGAACRGTTE